MTSKKLKNYKFHYVHQYKNQFNDIMEDLQLNHANNNDDANCLRNMQFFLSP